ncbi:hypothetical protein [Streptacidiphilus fuscans]|uniref:Vegetative cell wall protein gp1 n=1 Tax=Streptacidiphilus fuscans TaxID=2789292 RepID=A0A931FF55_9ACTN|nr:hypothetical protein [Streptacidiphilus fuscans]MBF9072512.1 hypothetical protein [Streptacidiphilus fuscans]
MTAFLAVLSSKVADRWVQVLLLPGLFFTSIAAIGLLTGQHEALSLSYLTTRVNALAAQPTAHSTLAGVLIGVGVSLVAAGAGMLADTLGALVQICWTLPADRSPASWLLRWRRKRWQGAAERLKAAVRAGTASAGEAYGTSCSEDKIRLLRRRLHRVGPAMPTCPTRVAERFRATARRTENLYGISDLPLVWPRLHAVVPDQLKTSITSAQADYAASARLAGWGLMYVAVASVWWPAAIVASAAFVACRIRAKPTADRLADLLDTTIDLHLADLAEKLGTERPDEVKLLGAHIMERIKPTL